MSKLIKLSQTSLLGLACCIAWETSGQASSLKFDTVVNNGDFVPNTERFFNSYNPPSVNNQGLVVWRGRSRGGMGQPATGIFTRDMKNADDSPILPIMTRGMEVPPPNNTMATFNEFPAFPRIDMNGDRIASRGQSNPVWQLPDGTRLGTSGIFTYEDGILSTGVNQLGAIAEFDFFSVPGTTPGTKFDQFPGSPAVTNGDTLVFKGNWTDDTLTPQTGVYFRDVLANGGTSPVQLIADSNTLIPGTTTEFGSTAPPSAAKGKAVFVGVDNEESLTLGGLYLSHLFEDPTDINPLVTLGSLSTLINDPGGLRAIGEGLSFDGHSVAFWGGWGTETFTQIVACPEEGNQARVQFCLDESENPNNPNGIGNGEFAFEVLANQGIFVTDLETTGTRLVAQTGVDFSTFLFWNFSGRVPGSENEEDGELARWRSSAFTGLSGSQVAFQGTTGLGEEGIYAQLGRGLPLTTVVQTGMDGSVLDPDAAGLPITSLAIERDGLRKGWFAISASMGNEEESWAGIYVTRSRTVPEPSLTLALFSLGILGIGSRMIKNR